MEAPSSLHIVMYPWFGVGHTTPFLHISNKLATKGHRISFIVPPKMQSKIQHLNRFPHLITCVPITVPHVDGLPPGAETPADVSPHLFPLFVTAMDRTTRDIELLLLNLKPHLVFYDFAYWIPKLAREIGTGIKTVCFSVVSPAMISYVVTHHREHNKGGQTSIPFGKILLEPPHGYPDLSIKLRHYETPHFVQINQPFGCDTVSLLDRMSIGIAECDAFVSKGSRELEEPFVNFIEKYLGKPMLLAGPVIPEPPISSFSLEEKWVKFLDRFEAESVIYCALGSKCILSKDQFQELLLGFELSGLPFLAALKPPFGAETLEEALPEGFEGRVEGRGVVHGGWIQQQLILHHPSVGCYVTHCGYGSLMEGLAMSKSCQLVMIPYISDQIFNTRLIANRLKAGVKVERSEEEGLFSRASVCKAIRTVMEENYSEVGREVRANCAKLHEIFLAKDMESSHVNDLSQKLEALVS